VKTGDITDAFLRALGSARAPAPPPAAPPRPAAAEPKARPPSSPWPAAPSGKGRVFLSEYHVRKALTPGSRDLTIPKDAIVSPLALEWLALQGVRIVRSS
jgi:hypothetical protein